MYLLLSITFLGFFFFPLLKQYQIHLDKSGMLQPIHQLLYMEQTAENGILFSHLPPGLTAAAPYGHTRKALPHALAAAGSWAWSRWLMELGLLLPTHSSASSQTLVSPAYLCKSTEQTVQQFCTQ